MCNDRTRVLWKCKKKLAAVPFTASFPNLSDKTVLRPFWVPANSPVYIWHIKSSIILFSKPDISYVVLSTNCQHYQRQRVDSGRAACTADVPRLSHSSFEHPKRQGLVPWSGNYLSNFVIKQWAYRSIAEIAKNTEIQKICDFHWCIAVFN